MYLKRTIILSNVKTASKILLIVEKSEKVVAKIKGVNFEGDTWAAFSFNGAPLMLERIVSEQDYYYADLPPYTNINEEICCAVFSSNESANVYYGGTENKDSFYATFLKALPEFKIQINFILDEEKSKLFEQNESEVEKQIDSELTNQILCECMRKECEDKCKDCTYKRAFYEKQLAKATEKIDDKEEKKQFEQVEEIKEKEHSKKTFYYAVEGSLSELFKAYPNDEALEKLIANSRFVKVDYEGDGNFYSVGVIYDDKGEEKYICYAIYGNKNSPPPKELEGFSQWLEVENDFGYYLMYQDAESGENIRVD